MTDRTHPDSGFPIAYSHYATYAEYVEALHARIAEREAQLKAIGAGGVSGPLMGQPHEMPDLSALTERGAKAWAGVDAQGLREGAASTGSDPATHVQNPAEIEHVAGDVSKNGPKSNMTRAQVDAIVYACRQAGDDSTYAVVNAALQAQQPAPSAAAVALPEQIADETVKAWQQRGDMPGYAFDFRGLIADGIRRAQQPSPTPQADSAPTSGNWVSDDDVNRLVRELDVALNGEAGAAVQASLCDVVAQVRLESSKRGQPLLAPQADSQPAPEYVGNGMFKGETIQKAAEHWANWCDVRCLTGLSEFLRVVAATPAFWTPEEIAAAKESAKKFEPWLADADRAARTPADSVPSRFGSPELQAMILARCVEKDQADSVLEDAARLDWLALAGPTSICVVIDRPHDGEVEVATDDVTGYGKTLREALDAARKQGGL